MDQDYLSKGRVFIVKGILQQNSASVEQRAYHRRNLCLTKEPRVVLVA